MAEWDASYVNDLPDSAFLLIQPGGHLDAEKKTVPRNLRMFPVYNAAGDVDAAHLRNALARIPQASTLTANQREAAMTKAKALAKAHSSVGGPAGTYEGTAGSGRSREVMPAEVMGAQDRTYLVGLELRDDGEGRTVVGRAVPYGQTIDIAGGKERFVAGAFARQVAAADQLHRIKLHASHSGRQSGDIFSAIGRTVSLHERPDGLHGAWRMHDTPQGNAALQLVKTGEVTGLSIGFRALDGGTRKGADGAYERHAAHLDHVVLTSEPAYPDAQVMSVRTVVRPLASFRHDLVRLRRPLDRVRSP